MSFKVSCVVVAASLIAACGGDVEEERPAGIVFAGSVDVDICGAPVPVDAEDEEEVEVDFGDGSDGELYLAFGDELALEETTYNFTNVNLDQGSIVTIVGDSSDGIDEIRINSLGVCNLLGDIELPDYRGTIFLNCYSSIVVEGSINIPNGGLSFATYDSRISSEGVPGSESGSVSTGSIDLSNAPEVTLIRLCP